MADTGKRETKQPEARQRRPARIAPAEAQSEAQGAELAPAASFRAAGAAPPRELGPGEALGLQRVVGNRAVTGAVPSAPTSGVVQRTPDPPRPGRMSVTLSGVTINARSDEVYQAGPRARQLFGVLLATLVRGQYSDALAQAVWADVAANPTLRRVNWPAGDAESGEPMRSGVWLDSSASDEMIRMLEEDHGLSVRISQERRELLEAANAADNAWRVISSPGAARVLGESLPDWYMRAGFELFAREMAQHGMLLRRYQTARQAYVAGSSDDTRDAVLAAIRAIISGLNDSARVWTVIRGDSRLLRQPGNVAAIQSIERVPNRLAQFLAFARTRRVLLQSVEADPEAREQMLDAFLGFIGRETTPHTGDERLTETPSLANAPAVPARLTSSPTISRPDYHATAGSDYSFVMTMLFRDYAEASAEYHFDFTIARASAAAVEAPAAAEPSAEDTPAADEPAIEEPGAESTGTSDDEPAAAGAPAAAEASAAAAPIPGAISSPVTVPSGEGPVEEREQQVAEGLARGQEAARPVRRDVYRQRMARAERHTAADIRRVESEMGQYGSIGVAARDLASANGILRAFGTGIRFGIETTLQPQSEARIALTEPGLYVVRCRATPVVAEGAEVTRAYSAAYQIVSVRSQEQVAGADLGHRVGERQRVEDTIAQIERALRARPDHPRAAELRAHLRDLRRSVGPLGPQLARSRYDLGIRIIRLESERTRARERRDQVTERRLTEEIRSLRQGLQRIEQIIHARLTRTALSGERTPERLTAAFVSDEGNRIPLALEAVEVSTSPTSAQYYVSDSTTPNSGAGNGRGSNRPAAIMAAVATILSGHGGYGRGRVSVWIDGQPRSRRIEASLGNVLGEAVENMATVASVAMLAAAPLTGGASLYLLLPIGAVSAIPAAYRIAHRSEVGTLRLDTAAVMDVVNIVGAAAGVLQPISTGLRLVRVGTTFMVVGIGSDAAGALMIPYAVLEQLDALQGLPPGERRARALEIIGGALFNAGIMAGQSVARRGLDARRTAPAAEAEARRRATGEGDDGGEAGARRRETDEGEEGGEAGARRRETDEGGDGGEAGAVRRTRTEGEEPAAATTEAPAEAAPTPAPDVPGARDSWLSSMRERMTAGGERALAAAREVIHQVGDWTGRLRDMAGTDGELGADAQGPLVEARNRMVRDADEFATRELNADPDNPRVSTEAVGSDQFSSDIDRNMNPANVSDITTPEQIAQASRDTRTAARRFMDYLRRATGGEPERTLDVNAYTYTGLEADVPIPREQQAEVAHVQDVAGLVEIRRGMGAGDAPDAAWQRFREESIREATEEAPSGELGRRQIEGELEVRERLERQFDQAESTYDDVVTTERRAMEELRRSGDAPADEQMLRGMAQELAADEAHRQLQQELSRQPINWPRVRELQSRIKLHEPGAYATRAAIQDVVGYQQPMARAAHAAPGETVPRRRGEGEVRIGHEVTDPRELTQSASSALGQLLAHASDESFRALRAVAKQCARIEHSRTRLGLGRSPDSPGGRASAESDIPAITNHFQMSRLLDEGFQVQQLRLAAMVADWANATGRGPETPDQRARAFIDAHVRWAQGAVRRMRTRTETMAEATESGYAEVGRHRPAELPVPATEADVARPSAPTRPTAPTAPGRADADAGSERPTAPIVPGRADPEAGLERPTAPTEAGRPVPEAGSERPTAPTAPTAPGRPGPEAGSERPTAPTAPGRQRSGAEPEAPTSPDATPEEGRARRPRETLLPPEPRPEAGSERPAIVPPAPVPRPTEAAARPTPVQPGRRPSDLPRPSITPEVGGWLGRWPGDGSARVLIEECAGYLKITDIYRGSQPAGAAGHMVADVIDAMRTQGRPIPDRLRISNVQPENSRIAYAEGHAAEADPSFHSVISTLQHRWGRNARSVDYVMELDHLNIDIDMSGGPSRTGVPAAAGRGSDAPEAARRDRPTLPQWDLPRGGTEARRRGRADGGEEQRPTRADEAEQQRGASAEEGAEHRRTRADEGLEGRRAPVDEGDERSRESRETRRPTDTDWPPFETRYFHEETGIGIARQAPDGGPGVIRDPARARSLRDRIMTGDVEGRLQQGSTEFVQGEWEAMRGEGTAPVAWWQTDGALRVNRDPEPSGIGMASQLLSDYHARRVAAMATAGLPPPITIRVVRHLNDPAQIREMMGRMERLDKLDQLPEDRYAMVWDGIGAEGVRPAAYLDSLGFLVVNTEALAALEGRSAD